MKTVTLTCDGCNEPIEASPGWPLNEYFCLSSERLPTVPSNGVMFAVAVHPALDRERHFHSFKCLAVFVDERAGKSEVT